MKIKCSKCSKEFEMPNGFCGRIVCEDCDPAMQGYSIKDMSREFRKKLAEKEQDCRKWTPQDCLEDLLEEIKAGRIKPNQLIVVWLEDEDEGYKDHGWTAAGLTVQEHIALLELSKWQKLEEWKA